MVFGFLALLVAADNHSVLRTLEAELCLVIGTLGVAQKDHAILVTTDSQITLLDRLLRHTAHTTSANELLPANRDLLGIEILVAGRFEEGFEHDVAMSPIHLDLFELAGAFLVYAITDLHDDLTVVLLFEHQLAWILTAFQRNIGGWKWLSPVVQQELFARLDSVLLAIHGMDPYEKFIYLQ